VSIVDKSFSKKRQLVLDQFCDGGFKEKYLNAILNFQEFAERVNGTDSVKESTRPKPCGHT